MQCARNQWRQFLEVAGQARRYECLDGDPLAPYLGLASEFVFLGSGYVRAMGLVVNEAMATGLSVIENDICGCCEDLLIEGSTDYSFSPNSMGCLDGLKQPLSKNRGARDPLAKAACEHSHDCAPEVFAKNNVAAYQSTVNGSVSEWLY